MKIRKICNVYLILMIGIILTGCNSQIPDMTEEQRAAISEYAVDLLLKYDTNQSGRLVDLDELKEEPKATPVPTKKPQINNGMDETADTPIIELEGAETSDVGSLKQVLGLHESISIEFIDYGMVEEYADEMGEPVIEATDGKKLLVCNFVLVNDGAQKQSVDLLKDNILYMIRIGEERINCQMTMLSKDLTTYMGILDSDESRKVVVIAECEEDMVEKASKMYFEVKRNDAAASISIK